MSGTVNHTLSKVESLPHDAACYRYDGRHSWLYVCRDNIKISVCMKARMRFLLAALMSGNMRTGCDSSARIWWLRKCCSIIKKAWQFKSPRLLFFCKQYLLSVFSCCRIFSRCGFRIFDSRELRNFSLDRNAPFYSFLNHR